ncbi:ATP-binding cassette domain-containing protein [Neisseriaceae bacterium ESL0693]|nr:ATP-binding cassette domain-containing protein [Neisseriaceae bacterium ESL0693]
MSDDARDIVVADNLVMTFPGMTPKSPEIKAIDGLSLRIKAGKMTAFVGPDGAGKTTFQRLVTGLYLPTSGSLTVLGIDVTRNPQAVQNQISYMPQRFGLYEDLSIQENLDLYADLHGVPQDERQKRFQRLLAITDLASFTNRPAGKLSGGMKQKLGLACTLVRSPELLLLDEPSVGVDPLSRRDLWEIIGQLVKEEQLSVIVNTAYMDEAEQCSHVFILHQGKILDQGSPAALKSKADGLTWAVRKPPAMKTRVLQAKLLEQRQYITDAVPYGDWVRFICCQQKDIDKLRPSLDQYELHSRQPELEDAFMLLLHAAQGYDDQEITDFKQITMPTQQGSATDQDKPVIVVRDLVRRFGNFTAVDKTSFAVERGEIFGLLGPNGAGKTTTFRMLCGLLPASSGFLEVAGMNLRTARAQARAKIGYVSQKFALYGTLTVEENLTFFGGAYGLSGANLKSRIKMMLEQFSLSSSARSEELPNGFKQRLSIAAALLHAPEIVFLDEPTSGLDPLARRMFWYTIGKLADQGVTMVITTHFMEEAEYCDRIVIQDAGKILALGTPDEVRRQADMGENADMNRAFIAIVENARHATHSAKEGSRS